MSLLVIDNIMSDMYKFLDIEAKVIFSVLDGETKNFEMSLIIK